MSLAIKKELDYKPISVSSGTYQYSKVAPQVALSTITSSAGSEVIFEISPKVMNLGKSVLSFTATPASTGSLTAGTQYMHLSTMPLISQVQLYTREGMYLCDIPNFSNYLKVVNRYTTKLSDLQNSDIIKYNSGRINGLHKSGVLGASTITESLAYRPTESEHNSKTPYYEAQYLMSSSDGSTAPGSSTGAFPVANYQFELSKIPFSIFQDKDTYFGQSVYLRFVFAGSGDFAFVIDHANSDDDPQATGATAYSGSITLSNLYVYSAIEINPVVTQAVMDQFHAGTLTYPVDYVYQNKQYLAAATNHNLNLRINTGMGSRLKMIFTAPFSTTESKNTRFDHSAIVKAGTATKVTSMYSTLNNLRTTQYDYSIANGDHWLAQKDMFLGSAIQSSNEFYYNFAHIENFTNMRLAEDQTNVVAGLPLNEEILYSLNVVTPASVAVNYYTFTICQRTLAITSAGVQLI